MGIFNTIKEGDTFTVVSDSNNFLIILSIVDKVKTPYLKGGFPLFLNIKDKSYLQNIISLISLQK